MPLESLGQADGKLNIKAIVTPEAEAEVKFDARTKWKEVEVEIANDLANYNSLRQGWATIRQYSASVVAQIFPDKLDQLGIEEKIFDKTKTAIKSELERAKGSAETLVNDAAHVLVLFPHKTREDLGITAADRENLKEWVRHTLVDLRGSCEWISWYKLINVFTVFPEFRDDFRDMLMEPQYRLFRNNLNTAPWQPGGYLIAAAGLRIIFPQFMNKDEMASLDWERIGADFAHVQGARLDFERLFYRQVLAADSVKLTSHGVEFTIPEQSNFNRPAPSLPELKK